MMSTLQIGPLSEPLTGRSWSPDEIRARVAARRSAYLQGGLKAQDRVFLHCGNTLEFFVELLAIWSLRGCAVPVDVRLTAFELGTLAESASPVLSVWSSAPPDDAVAAITAGGARVVALDEAPGPGTTDAGPPRGPVLDDDALILFTSGTTGDPKGVVHTHRSLQARWVSLSMALDRSDFERTLCLLPTHFGHGLICNCLFPWLSGNELHVLPPFRADMLMKLGGLIDDHGITFLSSVPPVWRLALKTAKPPAGGSLRQVFCGSAPLTGALWRQVQDWTGTAKVLNAYGITETASWLAGTTIPDLVPEDGLIGNMWGGSVAVLKAGETGGTTPDVEACATGESGYVWVNTPALMRGYFKRQDLTDLVVNGGWFSTGDIGYLDDRNRLYLRGREREEINKGGMKLFPNDVDSVVERFAGVRDVCTFGFDDALYGENIGMALVMDSATTPELQGLQEWMADHLAAHQLPVRWYLLDEIPRTSRGKINRASVAESCRSLSPVDPKRLGGSRQ